MKAREVRPREDKNNAVLKSHLRMANPAKSNSILSQIFRVQLSNPNDFIQPFVKRLVNPKFSLKLHLSNKTKICSET